MSRSGDESSRVMDVRERSETDSDIRITSRKPAAVSRSSVDPAERDVEPEDNISVPYLFDTTMSLLKTALLSAISAKR